MAASTSFGMSWQTALARPIKPVDHEPLRTLADARGYLLKLPKGTTNQQAWQYAAELLLAAAEDADPATIRTTTDQLERALFLSYRLDLGTSTNTRADYKLSGQRTQKRRA
jgi:hypothetical protein